MTMTPEDVKKAVTEALGDHRKEFWVEPEEHYLQHKFLAGIMGAGKTVKKTGIVVLVTTAVGYFLKVLFTKAV